MNRSQNAVRFSILAWCMAWCVPVTFGAPSAAAQGGNAQVRDTNRIHISTYRPRAPHPMTLDEIVSLRSISEPRMSPDGRRIAFLVRQGFRDCNCHRTALYVVGTSGRQQPRKLLEESSLSHLRWMPDGRGLSYLSARGGTVQLWSIAASGGNARPVFTHRPGDTETFVRRGWEPNNHAPAAGVLSYEWSPDGRSIAFTATPPTDTALKNRLARTGARYDDRTMVYFNILFDQWTASTTELWTFDVATKREHRLWRAQPSIFDGSILQLAWSPDGSRIAVSYVAPPVDGESRLLWNADLGVVDRKGGFEPVATSGSWEEDPVWSPDGRTLAFTSALNILDSTRVLRYDVESGARGHVATFLAEAHLHAWREGDRALIMDASGIGVRRELAGYYALPVAGGAPVRVTPSHLSVEECDDLGNDEAACVRQAPDVPPAVAIVSLRAPLGQRPVRVVANANPELRDVLLAPVTEMRWRNALGQETNGFLLRPRGFRKGIRYPLVIITYGFNGAFITTASPALTSYPAQTFAQNGFVVLLANLARFAPWPGHDFARGLANEGFGRLSIIESAVRQLVDEGVVDSTRVGMMGSSSGGYWTEYVMTHSTLLRASSIRNGADYNPGLYWLVGNSFQRDRYERYLGGPPYDSTLPNWERFSPSLNAGRVKGAVLMEFDPTEALLGLEMYAALRRHCVPTEFFVYPGDGHMLLQPEHRYYSMALNVDWFNFWLRESEDPDPSKRGQYARWQQMRPSSIAPAAEPSSKR